MRRARDASALRSVTPPPLRRIEASFAAPDHLLLFRRGWLPDSASRVLAVVHGFGEHSGRYDELATWFGERRCAVHAFDLRGHGRSAGTRTHVDRFDQYLDDLHGFLALLRDEHPGLPLVLIGHSMGGLISLAYLVERKPALSAAVISGPALAVDGATSTLRAALARILGRLAPKLSIASGLDATGLSRDPEVVRRYLSDPLVERKMTLGLGAELLAAGPRVRAGAAEIERPVLIQHGQADPLCSPRASEEFAKNVVAAGSALRIYPELRHEIFNEPERERVFADAWEWIEELAR